MTKAPSTVPFYFVSLGCPKNLVDSQVMLGKLQNSDYSLAQDPSLAEVIVINTCSFIQAAKEESIQTILDMADYKISGKCKTLVVTGCLPQRYSKELAKEIPEVDLMIGTGQYHRIAEFLNEHEAQLRMGQRLASRSYIDEPAFIHSESDHRVQTHGSYSAFLKLSEGCNRRCSFCIIPELRGNVRSRTVASLVEEATAFAQSGVKELNLVAQDLTHYGIEGRYQESLVKLLPRLAMVPGIEWIRLHYVYPDEFSDELIEVIASEPKIVKYLDMPIQHTSDRVLKLMNRRLTKAKLFSLVGRLRERIPQIVFRTSIIVGFPSETEEEFEELCSDLEALNLDHVGVFSFSREEGTRSAEMEGQIHASTKRRRLRKLIEVLQELSIQKRQEWVGHTFDVLVEGPSNESEHLIQGRLPFQAAEIDGHVLINDLGQNGLAPKVGEMIRVKITSALPVDVIGSMTSLS